MPGSGRFGSGARFDLIGFDLSSAVVVLSLALRFRFSGLKPDLSSFGVSGFGIGPGFRVSTGFLDFGFRVSGLKFERFGVRD